MPLQEPDQQRVVAMIEAAVEAMERTGGDDVTASDVTSAAMSIALRICDSTLRILKQHVSTEEFLASQAVMVKAIEHLWNHVASFAPVAPNQSTKVN